MKKTKSIKLFEEQMFLLMGFPQDVAKNMTLEEFNEIWQKMAVGLYLMHKR